MKLNQTTLDFDWYRAPFHCLFMFTCLLVGFVLFSILLKPILVFRAEYGSQYAAIRSQYAANTHCVLTTQLRTNAYHCVLSVSVTNQLKKSKL